MGITATFGEGIIPDHRNLGCHTFDLIHDITVAIDFQCIVFDIFLQEIGISIRPCHLFKLFRADRGSPAVGIYQFDIFLIVDDLIREGFPLHQVDQVSRHIHNTFALLVYIQIPYRTRQRLVVDQLKQMVHTLFHDSRFFGRTLQLLAINSRDSRKLALQHRSDLIPFGHDVIQHDVFLFGDSETFLQQFKALAVDRHRFVGKHIDAGLKRLLDIFGLLAVVSCLDHHVSLLLGQHFFQVIISRINDFIPSRRILRTCVESLYTFQVLVHVETGGCVHINIFRNLRIRHFLH